MIDLLASFSFIILLIATASLKLMQSTKTQQFKFYLLLATLLFLSCKIYNAIKYYDGVRARADREDNTPPTENNNAFHTEQKVTILPLPAIKFLPTKFARNPSIFKHVQSYLRIRKRGSEFARTYSP